MNRGSAAVLEMLSITEHTVLWKLGADQSLQSRTGKQIIKIAGDSECTLLEIVYINRAEEIRFRTRLGALTWLSDDDGEELGQLNISVCIEL